MCCNDGQITRVYSARSDLLLLGLENPRIYLQMVLEP